MSSNAVLKMLTTANERQQHLLATPGPFYPPRTNQ